MQNQKKFRDFLISEYKNTKVKNPLYSIRSFARFLGISKTTLSDFLNNKKSISEKLLNKILSKLNISDEEKKLYKKEILSENKNSKSSFSEDMHFIKEDEFALISDWYHIALLGITQLKNHSADISYLSKKLNVPAALVKEALLRLKRLKLIEIKNNKIIRSSNPIKYHSEIPSQALRNYNIQNLKNAENALVNLDVSERYFTSITIPSNKKKLKETCEAIEKAKYKISDSMKTKTPEDVYVIAMQIFPVTKKD